MYNEVIKMSKKSVKVLTKIINRSMKNAVEIAFAVLIADSLIVLIGSGIL